MASEKGLQSSLILALKIGLTTDQFWDLTQWQFLQIAKAYAEAEKDRSRWAIYQAWHTATYYRAKKLPSLDVVMSRLSGEVKTMSSDQIKSAMKEYTRSREAANA